MDGNRNAYLGLAYPVVLAIDKKRKNGQYHGGEKTLKGELVMINLILALAARLPNLIARCNSQLDEKDRRFGGYLCVFRRILGLPNGEIRYEEAPFLIIRVGNPSEGKWEKYLRFAIEKAVRLISHPDHISSWQSRNEDAEQYGGAIRTPDYVLAFSGHTEKADEAILAMGAFEEGLLAGETVQEIGDLSSNALIL